MAINDVTSGFTYTNQDIAGIVSQAKSSVDSIVSNVKLDKGGKLMSFAGMDANNIPLFEKAIDDYRANIAEIINGFNASAKTEGAFKGDVSEAVTTFLGSVKALLVRYAEVIKAEKKEIRTAMENYISGAKTLSANISADSDAIRSAANGIALD